MVSRNSGAATLQKLGGSQIDFEVACRVVDGVYLPDRISTGGGQ